MDIKIYQINSYRDQNRICYMGTESLEKFQGSSAIDSSLYDKIYEGTIDCQNLEQVFEMFNLNHPAEFHGHSLSVSDIVEVVEGGNEKPGFYFCDSIGFEPVVFDAKLTQQQQDTIRVVLLEPGKAAYAADIDSSLNGMQRVVGGSIEAYYPFDEQTCIVCNEEGKLRGMPLNRAIHGKDKVVDMTYGELVSRFREVEKSGHGKTHLTGYVTFTEDSFAQPYSESSRTYAISSNNKAFIPNMGGYSIYASCLDGTDQCVRLEQYMANEFGGAGGWKIQRCYTKEPCKEIQDIIAGTCFICDCSGENFSSLSDEQLKRYQKQFKLPERFSKVDGEIVAQPYEPKSKNKER
mgnify:CR=1 FL=1